VGGVWSRKDSHGYWDYADSGSTPEHAPGSVRLLGTINMRELQLFKYNRSLLQEKEGKIEYLARSYPTIFKENEAVMSYNISSLKPKVSNEEFTYNEETHHWEAELVDDCDVEILYNERLNRYEIRVSDGDYTRLYYSEYEPGVYHTLQKQKQKSELEPKPPDAHWKY